MNIGIDIDGVLTDVRKFTIEEGLKYCEENQKGKLVNPDAYSEDSPNNLKELSKITKMICMNWGYNKEIENENIYRCYNWDEIYNKINEIFNI